MLANPTGSVTTEPGPAEPWPSAAVNMTGTSGTGEPPASSTRTTTGSGSGLPAVPSWASPAVTTNEAGDCCTATWAVALSAPKVAVRVPDPFANAVTVPKDDAEKTSGSLLDQVTVAGKAAPYWSVTVAVKVAVSPREDSVADSGETAMAAARGGSGCASGPLEESPHATSAARVRAVSRAARKTEGFVGMSEANETVVRLQAARGAAQATEEHGTGRPAGPRAAQPGLRSDTHPGDLRRAP